MSDQPTEIRLTKQSSLLELDWEDGTTTRFTAAALRGFCRCAHCRSATRQLAHAGHLAKQYPGMCITLIEPMGMNAINLQFSDGHTRGIFRFTYLRSLSVQEKT